MTVADIIDRLQCEVALAKKHARFRDGNWTGAAELYLQVDDNAGLTPAVGFITPLVTEGTKFTLGVAGTLRGERQRIYNETLDFKVSSISTNACRPPRNQIALTGDLGITETILIAMDSLDSSDSVSFAQEKAFGQSIQFVIKKGATVGPKWELVRFVGPGDLLGGDRTDTHKLVVSFAKAKLQVKETPAGKKVVIPVASGRAQQNNFNLQLQGLQNRLLLR
ncbi:MAG: hypothetical protein WCE79_00110 [Xanthobacteraceae bacterium]